MNIPNMISLVRILLTPVFAVLYVRGALYQAMGVLLLCAVSDVLDGAIARRFNMVTDLGKALDPAADKLIQIAMMLCAATRTKAAWLLLALHLIRELSHLPEEIRLAAAQRDPSRLNRYVTQVATAFHKFYTECRIKEAEPAVRDARILLCQCTAAVIENTLSTFGVSAPDHM